MLNVRMIKALQDQICIGIGLDEYISNKSGDEFEMRLGQIKADGNFSSQVDFLWFTTLEKRLNACKDWTAKTHWIESEDTFFLDQQGRKIRQTRLCDPDTCTVQLYTICKNQLKKCTVSLQEVLATTNEILPSGVDALRCSYSRECPVNKEELPMIVQPVHMRIKQRKRFILASTSHAGITWNFDLTRCWEGANREEAEQRQHALTPKCEVEIELASNCQSHGIDLRYIVNSMLDKVLSLLR